MGNHMDKVMDGLYVGGFLGQLSPGSIKNSTHTKKVYLLLYAGAKEKEKLKENKITHILSIHDTAEPQFPSVCTPLP